MEKQSKAKAKGSAPKESPPVKKPAKNLVLKSSIHLPGIKGDHFFKGGVLKPGTVVTKQIKSAWDAVNKKIGGNTPIEKYCE